MIATSDRAGMFILGLICGVVAATVVYMVLMTLQEYKYGYAKRQIERRYRRAPKITFKPHVDPLIRSSHANRRR